MTPTTLVAVVAPRTGKIIELKLYLKEKRINAKHYVFTQKCLK